MINLNSKKLTKIVSAIMIVLMIVTIASSVFADTGDTLDLTKVKGQGTNASNSAGVVVNQVLGIVQVIAVGVAVIMLIVLAIKYISAAPSDKAEIKKSATVYVVGAVILFGSTGLLEIVKKFAENIKG